MVKLSSRSTSICTAHASHQIFVEHCHGEPDIKVHRANMRLDSFREVLLIDEQRRRQSANHDDFVNQITELGRYIQASCMNQINMTAQVAGGGSRFISH